MTLTEGKKAPTFNLFASPGEKASMSQYMGAPLIIYFYPKDDTSGCTKEALDFTSAKDAFAKFGAKIIGISPDSIDSHNKFVAKHSLTIELLSDPDRTVAKAYGVWVEKSMYGRKFMGVERATFLIDKHGKLARIWRKVRVNGHVDEVLKVLAEHASPTKSA